MIKSGKPRNQRRFRYTAPLHQRQHFLHAHIDKQLRKKLNLAKRTVQISKGDTVKIMSGSKRGSSGKVSAVNLRSGRIMIEGVTRKTRKGKETGIQVNVSNVYITDLNLTDKIRAAKLKVAVQPKPQPQQKKEKPATEQKSEPQQQQPPQHQHPAPQKPPETAKVEGIK
ncbi:MAG: 50S ribosomal protein L24 [Candidatus Marsarchaeota archaeon]|nr:50S ribosomal protein L24 [Candidatus Marsarchaeota archaeon]